MFHSLFNTFLFFLHLFLYPFFIRLFTLYFFACLFIYLLIYLLLYLFIHSQHFLVFQVLHCISPSFNLHNLLLPYCFYPLISFFLCMSNYLSYQKSLIHLLPLFVKSFSYLAIYSLHSHIADTLNNIFFYLYILIYFPI